MAHQASLIFDQDVQSNRGSKIPVGIHENVKVTGITIEDGYVDIDFEDADGRTHNKRLWAPSGKFPRKGQNGEADETPQAAIEREERQNLAHIVKLMHIFLGNDVIKQFPALDYRPFLDRAAKLLQPKLKDKTVNLKLILDAGGKYSTFGGFPDYIEEHVPGQKPTLDYSKWEKENHRTAADVGQSSSDTAPSTGGNAFASVFTNPVQ